MAGMLFDHIGARRIGIQRDCLAAGPVRAAHVTERIASVFLVKAWVDPSPATHAIFT